MLRFALLLVLVASATPAPAAAPRDAFVGEWPLVLQDADGGAYRVTLAREVYAQASDPRLRDLVVFNAADEAVAAEVFPPQAPLARPARELELPWFTLPAPDARDGDAWAVVGEVDADGRLRRVETRGGGRLGRGEAVVYLVDASRTRAPITALEIDWPPREAALDLGMRVEASEDLEHWDPVSVHGRLVEAVRAGRNLVQRRLELEPVRTRYLRLTPAALGTGFAPTTISAGLAPEPVAEAREWETLDAARSDPDAATFDFELGGRFPVDRADVLLPGNSAVEWTLESRDGEDASWRQRLAPWVAYRLNARAGDAQASGAQAINGVVRDRYWRLRARGPVSGTPQLRLGYRPEVLVFLAQGPAPFALAAGSATAMRADTPLPRLIAELRQREGADWQPAVAEPGPYRELAGARALQRPRDWTAWILWSVLVAGALVVIVFAVHLLRQGPPRFD
ncbi:DUF3999 domain-containing protein [Coralloluteibacterium stylophorae]|uniref:DUF3999 domain-containing protein n=3 Tax=Coralloluteibacterium stylophorae TaxID=1776034 RepID=A0A8J7VUZ1_9GAMM|nr:DUF3999 domain-containing protein [Coralloluteibacterium stylophorae]MBS7458371.1 DUF3999 domain-containing protein [Coralloluteibacterium stylophorae]